MALTYWVLLMANQKVSLLPENDIPTQALVFVRYLLKNEPTKTTVDLFARLVKIESRPLSSSDQKLLCLVVKHPWSLPFVDAGLALINPMSEVRRRLYIMFAVLECQPEYHDYFLPKQRPWWYLLVMFYHGFMGLFKASLGIVLIKVAS